MHIDLTGPWKIQQCENNPSKTIDFMLQVLTIIYHATGYPELAAIINKQSEHAEKKTDLFWFCRRPRPQE